MSTSRLISAAQKNPFVGTHTRPLLHNTTKAVDLALTRSTLSKERRGKNIFDYALRYKDLGVRLFLPLLSLARSPSPVRSHFLFILSYDSKAFHSLYSAGSSSP